MRRSHHEEIPDISFAGCGFMGIYHVGVSACLDAHAPHLLRQRIFGSSAGALAGAMLVGGVPLDVMARSILGVARRAGQQMLGALGHRLCVS